MGDHAKKQREARDERLAKALRENLRKRKNQLRARGEQPPANEPPDEEGAAR